MSDIELGEVLLRLAHGSSLLCRHRNRFRMRVRRIGVYPSLDLRTEMIDQALDRPGRRVPECTDGVALDLRRDLQQQINLTLVRAALGHASEHTPHPSRALAARRALAAALMLVEVGNSRDRADDV